MPSATHFKRWKEIDVTDEPDIQRSILKAYKDAGGDAGFSRWCKKHQTTLYDYYVKLMPQRTQAQVHVTHVDRGEQARAHLETAIMRIIAARKAAVGDPAAYHGGERVIDNEPPLLSAASTPGTDDGRLPLMDADQGHLDLKSENPKSPQKGTVFSDGGVHASPSAPSPGGGQNKNSHYSKPTWPSVPGLAAGAVFEGLDDKLSTTERFYLWNGHGRPP
jgi:hypothetical protein